MKRLILKMSITLDGFVGGANGKIDWLFKTIDEEARTWILAQQPIRIPGVTTEPHASVGPLLPHRARARSSSSTDASVLIDGCTGRHRGPCRSATFVRLRAAPA